MSIKANIPSIFHSSTNDVRTAEVNGSTVHECLKYLMELFPKLKLFDKDGELASYLGICVNGENAYPEELRRLVKDGDELSIILFIDGG